MPLTVADTVEDIALAPISTATDGQSSTDRSMADVEKGIQLAANLRAMKLRRRGIRFSQMIPSGPMGGDPVCGGNLAGYCGPFDQGGY